LAQLPDDLARVTLGPEPYERRTARTLTRWDELAADLAAVRGAGVAVSEEEYEIGLISISVPLRWIGRLGTAAVNISLPAARASGESRQYLTQRLRQAAREIDRELSAAGRGR
jgi:DNA-binding IclR family transcriptional regulator